MCLAFINVKTFLLLDLWKEIWTFSFCTHLSYWAYGLWICIWINMSCTILLYFRSLQYSLWFAEAFRAKGIVFWAAKKRAATCLTRLGIHHARQLNLHARSWGFPIIFHVRWSVKVRLVRFSKKKSACIKTIGRIHYISTHLRMQIYQGFLSRISQGSFWWGINGYNGHWVWCVGWDWDNQRWHPIPVEGAVGEVQWSVRIPHTWMFT